MKINHVDIWPVTMRLAEPYSVAYETVDTAVNVFLRITTDDGVIGYGCAAPDRPVTGETPESVLRALGSSVARTIKGRDPLRRPEILSRLKAALAPSQVSASEKAAPGSIPISQPSVLAAVDMALYDILGKIAGLPLWKLLGGYRQSIPISVTIGILPPDETVARAHDLISRGFRCLKLKGGRDVELDIERVLKTRDAVGDEIELRFDANQGYTSEDAVRFAEETYPACLELFEQPTPREQPDLLGRVARQVSVPVVADESLLTHQDAFRLANDRLVEVFNIKLMKVGGITEALSINAVAAAAGLDGMMGCFDESALGIAAALHVALACPTMRYADLDGHLDLLGDPASGSVRIERGLMSANDRPGLGCPPKIEQAWGTYPATVATPDATPCGA